MTTRRRDEYSELEDDVLAAQIAACRRKLLTPAAAAALNFADALARHRMRGVADGLLDHLLQQHSRRRR